MMKFIADRMLGKLAKKLRMLGYDTIYYRGEDPYQILRLARQEGRMILTRNTKLIPKRPEDHILRVSSDHPILQLKELIQKGYLSLEKEDAFSRCLICNTVLQEIPKESVEGRVPDFIFSQQKDFYQCSQCLRIYWPGSHLENMTKEMEELKRTG
ncbi:MAG: Mut7-C RNAse domain-containing protein [Thermodesulfobacteriota bacterium]